MKTTIYILIVALVFVSCDYLDIDPEAAVPTSDIDYSKKDNMFMPVSNAYASLRSNNVHAFPYMGLLEVTSDDADKGSTIDDSAPMIELDKFTYGPSNTLVSDYWDGLYNVVSAANNAIVTLPNFLPVIRTDADRKTYAADMAESQFIRAYAYFNLVRAYAGVPLVKTIMTSEELSQVPRSTADEIYAFIHEDLDAGVRDLPESYTPEWAGRVTKYSAMALKARVYLFQNKMDSVAKYTDRIMLESSYDLYRDFYKLFRIEGENCEESLFEIQSSTLGKQSGDATYCEYAYYQGPRGNSPSNMQGWGFKVPSQRLILFLASRNETERTKATIMERKSMTIEGDSIIAGCTNPYYNMKTYTPSAYNNWSYNGYGFDYNIRIIRFADVLLMNAEAKFVLGGDAATPLNRVRARVNLDPILNPTIQDIWDERRAEFALEETRFFDLVRTGRAATVLGPLGFTSNKNEVFPIPQKQRQLNPNLTQNPNY